MLGYWHVGTLGFWVLGEEFEDDNWELAKSERAKSMRRLRPVNGKE